METYTTNKSAKSVAVIIAFFPLAFGTLGLISTLMRTVIGFDEIFALVFSSLLMFAGYYLLKKNFVTIKHEGDDLIIKRLFLTAKKYKISRFKEIAMLTLYDHSQKHYGLGGNKAHAAGRSIGHMFLSYVAKAGKNNTYRQQLAVKTFDNKFFTLNTNNINDSFTLVGNIKRLSGVEMTDVHIKDYFAWKKGKLQEKLNKPRPKSSKPEFLIAIKPYFKAKYVVLPPLVIYAILIIVANIWFNMTHHKFKSLSTEELSNNYFDIRINPETKKNNRKVFANIYLSGTDEIILNNFIYREKHFFKDESDLTYHYSFYPFDNPFYFSRLINLDVDEMPEIISKPKDGAFEEYQIYDFDTDSRQFEIKSIESVSPKFARYITELKGYSADKWSTFFIETYLIFAALYFTLLFVFYFIVVSFKADVKKND